MDWPLSQSVVEGGGAVAVGGGGEREVGGRREEKENEYSLTPLHYEVSKAFKLYV